MAQRSVSALNRVPTRLINSLFVWALERAAYVYKKNVSCLAIEGGIHKLVAFAISIMNHHCKSSGTHFGAEITAAWHIIIFTLIEMKHRGYSSSASHS